MKKSESPKRKVVSSLKRKSVVAAPMLHSVATKIVVDDPMFIPQYAKDARGGDRPVAELVANIKAPIRLSHRATATVDCGFSMDMPLGYKAVVEPTITYANKGLSVVSSEYNGRVVVTVMNFGREIVAINHGDHFAQMAIEPVYFFNWVL